MAEPIEEQLLTLDIKLKQLKREYEQYFLGTRPREPVLLKGDVTKLIAYFTNTSIQNTAQRFRFGSLCSRYQALRRQWDEILRKIEAGTYERHRFKADRRARPTRAATAERPGPAASDDLYQAYVDARAACGQAVSGITREKVEGVLRKQRAQLEKKFGSDAAFNFRVAVENGKVKLKATRSDAS